MQKKTQCVDPHVHTHQQHICLTKTSQWDIHLGSKHLSHFCRNRPLSSQTFGINQKYGPPAARQRVESVPWRADSSAPEADDSRAILHVLLMHCWKAFKCSARVVITKPVPNVCAGFHNTVSTVILCGSAQGLWLKCIPFLTLNTG